MDEIRHDLYTQSEYARKIGKPRQRVYEMVREGKLPVVHVKGGILIKDPEMNCVTL